MARYLPQGTTMSVNSKLVGGLVSIDTPKRKRGMAETTDSGSGSDREYIPGLREGGTITLTVRHDPDDVGQKEIQTNYETAGSGAVVSCVLTLPDVSTSGSGGPTYSFDAFVTEPLTGNLGLVDDKAAEQQAVLQITGAVTVA